MELAVDVSRRGFMSEQLCVWGCGNTAQRAGCCWGHYKRKFRNKPLDPDLRDYGMSPRQWFYECMARMDEVANGDRETWLRAADNLRKAAKRWVASMSERGTKRRKPNGDPI